MSLSQGRILPRTALASLAVESLAVRRESASATLGVGRMVPRAIVDAAIEAGEILTRARQQATQILDEAMREQGNLKLSIHAEARADALAELSAQALLLRRLENSLEERQLERVIELAQVLAERLLGQALSLDPNTIVALAAQALSEARGARRLEIAAHPEDALALSNQIELLGMRGDVTIVSDPERPRGHLRFTTEIGVLDADLGEQLARLAEKLRGSFKG